MSKLSLNQRFGYVAGPIFIILGVIGMAMTGFNDFATKHSGIHVIIFEVNPLHNFINIGIGLTLLLSARTPMSSRMANTLMGIFLLFLGVAGLVIANTSSDFNVLALNEADNALHLVGGIMALAFAMSERPVYVLNS